MDRKRTYAELSGERPDPDKLEALPRFRVIALLENIRSLHNVGSMFRTADALRLEGLWLSGYTGRPPRPEITKTALGATESVPWRYFKDSSEAIATARKAGFEIWVLEQTRNSVDLGDAKPEKPVLLVVGNEVWGVSDEAVGLADRAVELPMYGAKQSLNVSVAFGVALYTLLGNSPKALRPDR